VSDLFTFNVYHGGALVLYALRQKIGNPASERVERTWAERYRGKSASTDDFIALASQVSRPHRDGLPARLAVRRDDAAHAGHPAWTVDPVLEATGLRAPAVTPLRR
jgi:hypothetical protein